MKNQVLNSSSVQGDEREVRVLKAHEIRVRECYEEIKGIARVIEINPERCRKFIPHLEAVYQEIDRLETELGASTLAALYAEPK
jgi:hypothetical protein